MPSRIHRGPAGPAHPRPTPATAELTERCAAAVPLARAVDTAADDVALLAFTSGTTGRPKATMHLHRDVLAIADTFGRHLVRIAADDVVAGTPPIAFTFGLGGLVVFPMRAGASTVLLDRLTPPQLADAVADAGRHRAVHGAHGYRAMLAAGKGDRLSGLRRAVSAGETLPAPVWHAVHDATGVRIIDGIGSTEMLHVFISAADDEIRPGWTGRAVPGYRAAVLDDDGRPVPDGTPGHLAVQGPTGCRYLDGDRQTSYVRHGWNLTGDTFVRDADGYFSYLARSDDMIVSSGYNISGPEVEQALLGHPDVLDCGVVGTPDEQRGALVTAYVVLRAGADTGCRRAAGVRQVGDRALQVPAAGRVRARTAPDQHRQAAALRAARARGSALAECGSRSSAAGPAGCTARRCRGSWTRATR